MEPIHTAVVEIDPAQALARSVQGFGVNLNPAAWADGALRPVLDWLVDELGCTHFRVDVFGKADWLEPDGPATAEAYARAYTSARARDGWAVLRHLQGRGVTNHLAITGLPPRWLLAEDGRTLRDVAGYARHVVTQLDWAVRQEGLALKIFSPINETDLGPPEGPIFSPTRVPELLGEVAKAMEAAGLGAVELAAGDFAATHPQSDYLMKLAEQTGLRGRLAGLAHHLYCDHGPASYREARARMAAAGLDDVPYWVTEYGDLDQTGEREWSIAWSMAGRLLDMLEGGVSAAMVWDAFDNHHVHDDTWSIHGLLRYSLRTYTPKKRYHAARHVFAHVRPGMRVVPVASPLAQLRLLGFAAAEGGGFVLAGLNATADPIRLSVRPKGDLRKTGNLSHRMTTETENYIEVDTECQGGVAAPWVPFETVIRPRSVFSLTTLGAAKI